MLECEYCNYLLHITGKKICKCDFTGFVFIGKKGFELQEYPCKNRSYEEYLIRKRKAAEPAPIHQGGENRVFRLSGDDWRFLYQKEHPLSRLRHARV